MATGAPTCPLPLRGSGYSPGIRSYHTRVDRIHAELRKLDEQLAVLLNEPERLDAPWFEECLDRRRPPQGRTRTASPFTTVNEERARCALPPLPEKDNHWISRPRPDYFVGK